MDSFSFAATPHIHFGVGMARQLPALLEHYAKADDLRVLLVTGKRSFENSTACQQLWRLLQQCGEVQRYVVSGEPSPQLVDTAVQQYADANIHCVVGIGGGSVIDAAKAIAGLLQGQGSIMDFLEGVGRGKIYPGSSMPWIALPTTAGTGSESSKNAVISIIAADGFKKSFRHDSLVATHIILDPELTLSCPADVTAACGMDALTQLLESYVSSHANPMTDALAWSGLQALSKTLLPAYHHGQDIEARSAMLYASSISGLTLANAGLGSVHGLASPLGAFYAIPHGVVCGTLLAEACRINIQAMQQRQPSNPALVRYAQCGRLLVENAALSDNEAQLALLDILTMWTKTLDIPKLACFGVQQADIEHIIANISGGSMKSNPIVLTSDEITQLLLARI